MLVNEAGPKRKRKESQVERRRSRRGRGRGGCDESVRWLEKRRREGEREEEEEEELKAMGRQKSTVLKAPHGLAVEVHE